MDTKRLSFRLGAFESHDQPGMVVLTLIGEMQDYITPERAEELAEHLRHVAWRARKMANPDEPDQLLKLPPILPGMRR